MAIQSHRNSERASNESESDHESFPIVRSLAEIRRARYTRFNEWMLQTAEKNLNAQIKRDQKTAVDEELSIRALLAQNEPTQIITDPREYQVELFERAKKQNTIAVLDTGSGKTLIAVLLLRHVIDQELEDRRLGKPDRIAFFLVLHAFVILLHHHILLTLTIGTVCNPCFPAICRS
jgi:endoribonuclease Dicer